MNAFDESILSFLNGFARRSPLFDLSMVLFSVQHLWKGAVVITCLWWAWFHRNPHTLQNRQIVITAVLSSFAALFIARALALALPFRQRPMHNADLGFQLPFGTPARALEAWSSFPSDHATYFFAMGIGLILVSRSLGAFALLYIAAVICFPRIYIGFHYPTDILAGAAIGSVLGMLAAWHGLREWLARPFLRWEERHPAGFYAMFFLASYLLATLFDDLRTAGSVLTRIL